MVTNYQYVKAVEEAGGDESKVNRASFCYPGPRPQTRETAILMLADGAEAVVRAARPNDDEALRSLIRNLVDSRLKSGELDDTRLTIHDLHLIVDSFTATLRGIYHPRLEYPKLEAVKEAAMVSKDDPSPTVPAPRRGAQEPATDPDPRRNPETGGREVQVEG